MAARLPLAILLALAAVAGRAAAQDYDFFYLVLQWPGSYCDTKQSCCYPKSGKPTADFGIHGLWPNRDDGSYPQNCNPDAAFNPSKVRRRPTSIPFLPLRVVLRRLPCRCCSACV
jgi:ribonuclease T2